MRVWVVSEKMYREYPSSRWCAEWQEFRPNVSINDDFDPVNDTQAHREYFDTDKSAIAFAKSKLGIDFFGCPTAYKEELEIIEAYVADWEIVSERIECT